MKRVVDKVSKRAANLQALIFQKLDYYRQKTPNALDLSRGVPIGLPPRELLYELNMRSKYAENHVYTDSRGLKELREEVAYNYKDRFNVDLDPETEVQILMGSREGISNLLMTFVNPGEGVLLPDPCFPVYMNATKFCEGTPVFYPLYRENNYLPQKKDIEAQIKGNEKVIISNYPHSPTGAVCSISTLELFVDIAKKHDMILLHDAVYRELSFKDQPTLLQVTGAKDVSVEVGSLSKTFNMSGWRIAYMVGNRDVLKQIRKTKLVCDVGQFVPIQYAAALALKMVSYIDQIASEYSKKVNKNVDYLESIGLNPFRPSASFSIWCKVPDGFNSAEEFVYYMWKKHGVIFMPGTGYGKQGEGYFRISLTPEEAIVEAGIKKLAKIFPVDSEILKDNGDMIS